MVDVAVVVVVVSVVVVVVVVAVVVVDVVVVVMVVVVVVVVVTTVVVVTVVVDVDVTHVWHKTGHSSLTFANPNMPAPHHSLGRILHEYLSGLPLHRLFGVVVVVVTVVIVEDDVQELHSTGQTDGHTSEVADATDSARSVHSPTVSGRQYAASDSP